VVETIDIRDRSIVRVSRPLGHNTDPSWSPDGRWITYGLEIDGEHHQVIVAPDGSGYRDLGMVGGCVMGWSPDSKYLFGFTTECFSSKITRIPIDDPSAAVVRDLPGNLTGMPDWQRVAP
jgi:Tol biopolymer transport system component